MKYDVKTQNKIASGFVKTKFLLLLFFTSLNVVNLIPNQYEFHVGATFEH